MFSIYEDMNRRDVDIFILKVQKCNIRKILIKGQGQIVTPV